MQKQQWKNCEQPEKRPAWQPTKVKNKSEVIAEARTEGHSVHFPSLMDLCHLKKFGVRASISKERLNENVAPVWMVILLAWLFFLYKKRFLYLVGKQCRPWVAVTPTRQRLENRVSRRSDGSVRPKCRSWSSEGGRVQLEVRVRGRDSFVKETGCDTNWLTMHMGLRIPQLHADLHEDITNALESLAVARSEWVSLAQMWPCGSSCIPHVV